MKFLTVSLFVLLLFAAVSRGHDGDREPSHVSFTEKGDKRVIEANGLPDHQPGQFPNRGNPHAIEEQKYHFEIPLHPLANSEPMPLRGMIFGVAVNGVVFDPGTAEVWRPGDPIVSRPGPDTRRQPGDEERGVWNYEGMGRMNLGIDNHHAHVQPNGAYHYHGLPNGLIKRLREEQRESKMLLVGYAADGFPIYAEYGHSVAEDATSALKKLHSSYQMKSGKRPTGDDGPGGEYDGTFVQDYEFVAGSGDLDECNGREGVTPDYPQGTYYYVLTDSFPFVPRAFHGTPDPSFEKHGPGRPGDRGRPPRRLRGRR
jgi:hypothetical protein